MQYLIDACWIINILNGRTSAAVGLQALSPSPIYLCWTPVAEVYEGAFHTNDPAAHIASLRAFLAPYPVVPFNDAIAESIAEDRAALRKSGQSISDFDVILGATALHYDLSILTFNVAHIGRIPGIQIYRHTASSQ